MGRYILRWAPFLLFLIIGYQVIAPPVLIFSLKRKARSYITSQVELALDRIKKNLDTLNRINQDNFQAVFNDLSIPADDLLEREIFGYYLRIRLLIREEKIKKDPEFEDPPTEWDEAIYHSIASYPDPGDKTIFTTGSFYYPYINWSWINGQRGEYWAKWDIKLNLFIPVMGEGKTERLIMIESSALNLYPNLEKMWRSYRLRLILLLPVLFLLYFLLEFWLIGKKDLHEVTGFMDKNTEERWYPPWLMILGKNNYVIVLFILIYPILGYYVIDMNNFDFGVGTHVLLLIIMGLPLFFALIVYVISGIKHRRLFRYGIVRPSVYKKSEIIKVQTPEGIRPRTIHKFIYEYESKIFEMEVSPSDIKRLAKQQKYHALFLPQRTEKAILIELYLSTQNKSK